MLWPALRIPRTRCQERPIQSFSPRVTAFEGSVRNQSQVWGIPCTHFFWLTSRLAQVLSLGLPPPAIHIPAVGWSASTSPHDWLGKLFCGSRTDPSVTSFHRPTLLFSQLTREASRDSEDGLKGMGAAGMPKGPSKAAHHDLTNNGRGEDNEGGLDALAICGSFQRQSSSDVLGRGVCLAHLNGKTILLDTHSEDTSFSPVRGTATRGVPTDGRSSNPRTSRSSRELCGPSLGVPESSFLRKVPPKHYFSDSDALIGGPTLATLGSLYKRGVLVRAMQRLPWLSVVGFRFIKVATWCNLCGLVRVYRRQRVVY